MKALIIILIILSAMNIQITYSNGKKSEFHYIPALIALILFCLNY